ncbi:1219_t:CDS:2 [Cetraspora pellucida]|uniref:1219_t:CDS:1 n=1 Tax=Cetraspora pellucida TaxID=1433469 RepID=A0ACA9MTM2_9GLOM|nr:1219_t:CDS:2 [Cetraspora pellucida]
MSHTSIHNLPSATWQWVDPLKSLFLIVIIVVWGYCLDICGGQPNYSLEIQRLMGLGTFFVTIAFSYLIQLTFSHIFSYVQGFFLTREQGIPLDSIVIGGSPLRVSIEFFNMLRKKHISVTMSYLIILIAYILSFGIGAYTTSNLGAPYIMETNSFKWVQAPTVLTKELNDSMYNAFVEDNFFGPYSGAQFNALITFLTKQFETELKENISITNQVNNDYLNQWKRENMFENVGMQYLASQCNVTVNLPCGINSSENIRVMANYISENKSFYASLCTQPIK